MTKGANSPRRHMTADDRLVAAFWRNVRVLRADDQVDVIVCVPCNDDHPLLLLDNEIADCCRCGGRVQFRPNCPQGPKTCVDCALKMIVETKP